MHLFASPERKLILTGLTGLLLSFVLFKLENWRVEKSVAGPAIANASRLKNEARRKGQGSFVFQSLVEGNQLYEGDSVFTGPDSQVTITFEGRNTSLTLQPLSQVKVYIGDGHSLQFDLAYGNIEGTISKDESFLVTGAEGRITSTGNSTKISVQRRRDGRVNYSVREGSALISGRNGQQTISEKQSLQLDPSTDIRRTPPVAEIDLVSPPDAALILTGKLRHQFLARAVRGAKMIFRLEGAGKKYSTLGISDVDVSVGHWANLKSAGLEDWTWSAEAFDRQGRLVGRSSLRRFSLVSASRPVILTPKENSQLYLPTDGHPTSTLFRWKIRKDLEPWIKEVRLRREGPEIREDLLIPKKSEEQTLSFAKSGQYEIRLVAEFSDGQILEGEPRTIKVEPPLTVPQNIQIPQKLTTTLDVLKFGTPLAWIRPKEATAIEIQIAENQDFVAAESKISANRMFWWVPKTAGKYFFRLRSLSADTSSIWTATYQIDVEDVIPQLITKQKEILVTQNLEGFLPVQWEAKIEGSNLQSSFVARLKDSNGAEIAGQEVKNRQIKFAIPHPGNFKVELVIVDSDQKEKFLIEKILSAKETCTPPLLTQPLANHKFVILGGQITPVHFTWASNSCFQGYQVQIESIPPSRERIFKTQQNSLDLKIRLGSYRWRARGVRPGVGPGWSDWSNFSVVMQR